MEKELQPYDYELPPELIAQSPASPRDHARLLVYERAGGRITDDYFYNLLDYLPADSTLVLNNSKVEKARLKFGRREVFLTKTVNRRTAEALVFPGKDFKAGQVRQLDEGISVEVQEVLADGQRRLKFSCPLDSKLLEKYRRTPFPPYIEADEQQSEEYQTVYARHLGSQAAPTAGLHFTESSLNKIKSVLPVIEVTLHVGLGTFAPLKGINLKSGKLHSESYEISPSAAKELNQAGHITAVGTTTLRSLESNISGGKFRAGQFATDIFIRSGYKFQAVDALITNFHLPKSSLLMLVGALMGVEEMQRVYKYAVDNKYRFFSFGDAMLIL